MTFNLSQKKVQISPTTTNKQSVTVYFSNSENQITINDPVVGFWECFFFYGIFLGIIIYGTIYCGIFVVKLEQEKYV